MSTALYRRYRPDAFADVIGQEHVTEPLMRALSSGRIGHAYLFSGPRGCGKTTSARILARCLNCEAGPTATPCGSCDSCIALARGGSGSIDVIEIDAASHGGVDDARELRERAAFAPADSRFKVYIIDEAHMVTTQGFNALLKIVEEPPEHVKFVFATTEPEKVIGTIRSRTHHYPFRLVPPARLHDYLATLCAAEGVAAERGVLSFVVRAGGGSVRDSLSVLDQLIAGSGERGLTYEGAASLLGFTDGELLDATITALAAGDSGEVFRQIDKVIDTGIDPRRYVEDVLERFRDLIVLSAVPDADSSVLRGQPVDQIDRMRVQAAAFGPGALSRAADVVNAGLTEMTGATSPRLQLELIAARVLLPGAAGEHGYAARLDRLERRLDVGGAPSSAVSRKPPSGSVAEPLTTSSPPSPPVVVTPPLTAEPPTADPAERAAQPGAEPTTTSSTSRPDPWAAQEAATRPASAPTPSAPPGLDLAALRRSWPDILGKIFTLKRATWTFLSEHGQIKEYDGHRVVLEIATVGLTSTFRGGVHADIVRQALIDVLGLDVRVEAVAAARSDDSPASSRDAGPTAGRAESVASGDSPVTAVAGSRARAMPAPDEVTPPSTTPTPSPDPSHGGRAGSGAMRPHEWSDGASTWGSAPTGGAPTWATDTGPTSTAALEDDADAVSADDESLEERGEVGQVVVERLLGARVIRTDET